MWYTSVIILDIINLPLYESNITIIYLLKWPYLSLEQDMTGLQVFSRHKIWDSFRYILTQCAWTMFQFPTWNKHKRPLQLVKFTNPTKRMCFTYPVAFSAIVHNLLCVLLSNVCSDGLENSKKEFHLLPSLLIRRCTSKEYDWGRIN